MHHNNLLFLKAFADRARSKENYQILRKILTSLGTYVENYTPPEREKEDEKENSQSSNALNLFERNVEDETFEFIREKVDNQPHQMFRKLTNCGSIYDSIVIANYEKNKDTYASYPGPVFSYTSKDCEKFNPNPLLNPNPLELLAHTSSNLGNLCNLKDLFNLYNRVQSQSPSSGLCIE